MCYDRECRDRAPRPTVKILNAGAAIINMHVIRLAIIGTGRKPETAVMHPAQVAAIADIMESIILTGTTDEERIRLAKKFIEESPPVTIAGIPIVQDPSLPPTVIEFRDSAGMISRIENLAVPA